QLCRSGRHDPRPQSGVDQAMSTTEHWIQTQRGRSVDLLNPTPDDIDPHELASLLSRLHRFGGHTRADLPPYTVAQHSVLCSWMGAEHGGRELLLAALLHDAHEGYLGCDLTRPLKAIVAPNSLSVWA